jgi:DNA-directed RNA polymerase specialized sigma24 family protein
MQLFKGDPILIEKLVAIYQKDPDISTDALELLIKYFEPSFGSYIKLVFKSDLNELTYQRKVFLTCLMNKKQLSQRIWENKMTIEDREYLLFKLSQIRQTYSNSRDDFKSDMIMLFIELLRRYKKTDKNFTGYFTRVYPYELYRYIKKHYIDEPTCWKKVVVSLSYDEPEELQYEFFEELIEEKKTDINRDLSSSWISEDYLCSEVFSDLTAQQKELLVLYYERLMNDKMISEKLKLHINTINQRRRQVVKTLGEKLKLTVKRNRRSGKNIIKCE